MGDDQGIDGVGLGGAQRLGLVEALNQRGIDEIEGIGQADQVDQTEGRCRGQRIPGRWPLSGRGCGQRRPGGDGNLPIPPE